MTWRGPEGSELRLLADARASWPEVIPLARVLALAPRIEPLLLRNARLRFLPKAGAEIESQLWFCPLVAARSTREIVLHLGLARVLAGQLGGATPWPLDEPPTGPTPDLTEVWRFTQQHTRHWTPEDRLERDLRYHALSDDDTDLDRGLRSLLAEIARESDTDGNPARRRDLARLAKRVLPAIRPAPGDRASATARLLARYAALALSDAGDWTKAVGMPDALPDWLDAKLPRALAKSKLGIEVRADAVNGQVLHLVEPSDPEHTIELPTALPGRLHVAPAGHAGEWHPVRLGTRIPIRPPSTVLRLGTLVGAQWDLVCDSLPPPLTDPKPVLAPLLLVHAPADREQAEIIARWLRSLNVAVDVVVDEVRIDASEPVPASGRILRLWTRAASEQWAGASSEPPADETAGLVLRTEAVAPPDAGSTPGRLLDWLDWQQLADSPLASDLAQAIAHWWREGALPPAADPPVDAGAAGEAPAGDVEHPEGPPLTEEEDAAPAAEIQRLLAEIDNPDTTPPRRLDIGDRLAELGDPRPGVGTIEIEVPLDAPEPKAATPDSPGETQVIHVSPGFDPELQSLLDEIADPATEPPRRLAIGDRLAELGDPRPGVGLRPDGLPDIAWVEIPDGPFLYQDGERHELPTFWIAKYPLTNAQYQCFIDDGGYKDDRWWRDLRRPEPRASRWPQPNRPRTHVDWYEAVAFCRWLAARLALPEDCIRLPTELEWEKAARGENGLRYPWGKEYLSGFANVNETSGDKTGSWSLKQTTAVGVYPHGRSPYGVEDLAGTVWEWCLNKRADTAAIEPDTSGAVRALRGGTRSLNSRRARTDVRIGAQPVYGGDGRGFRLLSSVPIDAVH